MMINDAKTCNCTTNDSNSILQRTERGLTECLHNIESKINRISKTMFFEMNKEREYPEPKDMNTEIIHDHEVALAIIDALCRLASGIGIDQ